MNARSLEIQLVLYVLSCVLAIFLIVNSNSRNASLVSVCGLGVFCNMLVFFLFPVCNVKWGIFGKKNDIISKI